MEVGENNAVAGELTVDSRNLEEASQPFVGRWNRLVSNTNWEKGRIIYQWREALRASGAPNSEYSDEAWSLRVGGVTGQNVGRLRRVYQRFGQSFENFDGLFWSHFQAAIDWDDAEMWLEGSVQNGWSVARMRTKRWETMGALASEQPDADDVVAGELDEDFEPALNTPPHKTDAGDVAEGPADEGPDFGDETGHAETPLCDDDDPTVGDLAVDEVAQLVRPFEKLSDLPEDLATAFESFKLALLHHKLAGWQEIGCAQVLAALDALKQLAVAPSD